MADRITDSRVENAPVFIQFSHNEKDMIIVWRRAAIRPEKGSEVGKTLRIARPQAVSFRLPGPDHGHRN